MKDGTNNRKTDISLLLTNASDLLGRQSVRATFKLSAEFIDAVSILATQLGIKQKSLFDHLMEDVESLRAIASRMESDKKSKNDRIQKTFVISKKSLLSLEAVSKKFAASRDDIVEYSIKRLFPILSTERQKQERREDALEKISKHFHDSKKLLDYVKELVGKDDPVYTSMEAAFNSYENTHETIKQFVSKGKRITELSIEKFEQG